ncbi:N-glycosylation protein-domain-containing protein [Scheffersomyces xylosifermentans]|uniref:N-glycosylation protein-domain-containing protein n=1 Tax=Scheffersomyces xylosifermentans TaxID=1304137 RepID=UPI00315C5E2F
MVFMDSIRRRFSNNFESHQIDDDYTEPARSSPTIASNATSTSVAASTNNPGFISTSMTSAVIGIPSMDGSVVFGVADDGFDPNEVVPSYETSQLLHERQNSTNTNNSSTLGGAFPVQNDTIGPIIPGSVSISRNSSFVGDAETLAYIHSQSLHSVSLIPPQQPSPPLVVPYPISHSASSTTTTTSSNNNINGNTNNNNNNSNIASRKTELKRQSLKQLGLKFLNARQHFALALSRDVSLIPPLIGFVQSWKRAFVDGPYLDDALTETGQHLKSITSARLSEHFLTGVWCIVSAYLSFSVLDGLIVRWIVTYSTPAAIVRVLSMSTMIIAVEQYLVSTFSADGYKYGLHIWILISCCLTLSYIVQNFVTSNIDLKKGGQKRARFFDIYNIAVFAVVPVGMASFITMIGLLRSLLILRIDIDETFADRL